MRFHFSVRPGLGVIVLFWCATLAGLQPPLAVGHPADAYLASIERIRSYDVTIRAAQLEFVTPGESADRAESGPREIQVYEVRDVFVWGFGRRLERQVGETPRDYRVASWDEFKSGQRAKNLSPFLIGLAYGDYLNPAVGDRFLSELLLETRTKGGGSPEVDRYALSQPVQLELEDGSGLARVWFEEDRGGMVKRVQWLRKRGGNVYLNRALEISNYTKSEEGIWMPTKGTITFYSIDDGGKPLPHLAFSMGVTEGNMALNVDNAPTLVSEKSLPEVNLRKKGWACYYDPEVLAAIEEADQLWDEAVWESLWRTRWMSRALVLAVALSLGIFIIRAVKAWRRTANS